VERRWKRQSRFREVFVRRQTTEAAVGAGGKMNAEAVVLEELKIVRNSDKLVNALSLLTSLS
jgi:hypothetical protein